jgi:ankyrin repeat protein
MQSKQKSESKKPSVCETNGNSSSIQWQKRYEDKKGNWFEIGYDVIDHVLTTRTWLNGKVNEEKCTSEQIIAGIYDYDKALQKGLAISEKMGYVNVEGINGDATKSLVRALDEYCPGMKGSPTLADLKKYIDNGADVNASQIASGYALMLAVMNATLDEVKLLVESGASVDVVQRNLTSAYYPGATPIAIALFEDHLDVAEYLVSAKADLDFHLDLAAQGGLLFFASMDKLGVEWDHIMEEYKETWGKVVEYLKKSGAKSGDRVSQLQKVIAAGASAFELEIDSLADLSIPEWDIKIGNAIDTFSTPQRNKLISTLLNQPKAIAHPKWGELMMEIIKAQPNFAKVAAEVYEGEDEIPLSPMDDEGWLSQSWGEGSYSNGEEILKVLSRREAIARDEWPELVQAMIDGDFDCPLDLLHEFFDDEAVHEHDMYDELHEHYQDTHE